MRMSTLLEQLERAAPFADAAAVERALEATLGVLAELVPAALARDLSAALPSELGSCFVRTGAARDFDVEAFDAEVGRRAGVSLGLAGEQAAVVLQVLAHSLDGELVQRLRLALAPRLAERLSPRERAASPAHPGRVSEGHTLAAGRPGGTRQLHEAAPGALHPLHSSQPRGAQTGSVASDTNPHGDSKLSSARDTTQEREHETLADGRNKGRE